MRKFLIVMIGLAVFGMLASQANAVNIGEGLYSASITDRSNVFSDQGNGYNEAEAPAALVDNGDEQRTAFSVDAIAFGTRDVNPISGDIKITETGPNLVYTPKNLKGMLYDINVSSIKNGQPLPGDGLIHDIYKAPGGRYTDALGPDGIAASGDEGTDGIWTDTYGTIATSAAGYGGIIVVYEDMTPTTPSNPFAPGPAAWLEPGQPGHVAAPLAGVMTDSDYYPGISDSGTPWLIGVLTPLPLSAYNFFTGGAPAGTVLVERNFNIDSGGTGGAQGVAFLNVIGGTAAALFDFDFFGPGLDVRLEFDIDFDVDGTVDANPWQIQSDDPVQFGVIPEPTTFALIGLGAFALFAKARRKW